jgi:hypothetical protein
MFEELFQDSARTLILLFWLMLAMTMMLGALVARMSLRD